MAEWERSNVRALRNNSADNRFEYFQEQEPQILLMNEHSHSHQHQQPHNQLIQMNLSKNPDSKPKDSRLYFKTLKVLNMLPLKV